MRIHAGQFFRPKLFLVLPLAWGIGCQSAGEWARVVKENEELRRSKAQLERTVGQREGTIAVLQRQVETLQGFGPARPATAFAPVRIEIASLSGGADYDGRPGDDGVTVHVRLIDGDGDRVKAPGRLSVQLVDNSQLGAPRVIGVYRFEDLATLRKAWHGRFATYHYSLRCPFPPGVALPPTNRLDVRVEFVDFLTGATLTAQQEVSITAPPGAGSSGS